MQSLLFVQPLRTGALNDYKKFNAEILHRKSEYEQMLKRYGMRTTQIWHQNLEGIDYIFVLHEADDDALEKLKGWASSQHPFDLWFKNWLDRLFDTVLIQADLLFEHST